MKEFVPPRVPSVNRRFRRHVRQGFDQSVVMGRPVELHVLHLPVRFVVHLVVMELVGLVYRRPGVELGDRFGEGLVLRFVGRVNRLAGLVSTVLVFPRFVSFEDGGTGGDFGGRFEWVRHGRTVEDCFASFFFLGWMRRRLSLL